MARTGSSTIIASLRKISRMKAIYGAEDFPDRTNDALWISLQATLVQFDSWWSADDHPGEVDITPPFIPGEDL